MKVAAIAVLATVALAPAPQAPTNIPQQLGYPADARLLIIHADDLGMSHAVNRATFEALERGWITSSSILVPCPWFPEVARFARTHPDADLGIHLAINSEWTTFRWGPVAGRGAVPSLVDGEGYMAIDENAAVAHATPADVERELRAQIDFARAAGIHLSHLDSHMATLFHTPELFAVYRRMGQTYGLPVLLERGGERGGSASPWGTQAVGEALLDRIVSIEPGVPANQWLSAYEQLLAPLPRGGVYQLIVHLAYSDAEMRGATSDHPDWGAAWRQQDFDMVKSAAFQDFLKAQGFTLITWRQLGKLTAEAAKPAETK